MNGSLWANARAVKLSTAPTLEPVTVSEAQVYCRLPVGEEDELFARWIRGAREQVELYLGRALLTQTWDYILDGWPTDWPGPAVAGQTSVVELPYPPLQSVTSITTYNPLNVSAVFSSASYLVDSWSEPGRVALNSGYSWPVDLRLTAGIVIRFVAGYGSTAASVPAAIQDAILALVAQRARFRGDDEQEPSDWPPSVLTRLAPYRVIMR
jgi:uncharacterized phiE125 gp8 family phage protein